MSQAASLPRVIDFWLGGPQHTPADAAEGAALASAHPDLPALYRSQRLFQRAAVERMTADGIGQFLVFEAGLPTAGHVHEQMPEARVYYTDKNFDVVQPGAGLLAGVRRRVRYQTLDATDLESLEDLEFSPVLKTDKPIGVLLIGATEAMDDDTLALVLKNLHTWAQPGSQVALTFADKGASSLTPYFESAGKAFNLRDSAGVGTALGGWSGEIGAASALAEGAPSWLQGVIASR